MFSYRLRGVWYTGLLINVFIMGAAFSGYVLVGSQMRFWAAIVITRLLGVIPKFGETILFGTWGGYSINWITYQTIFVLHFVLPFLVMGLMFVHLNLLHRTGRTNLVCSHRGFRKTRFFPFYWGKDIINMVGYMLAFFLILVFPYSLGEVELFEEANSLNSPIHILPE